MLASSLARLSWWSVKHRVLPSSRGCLLYATELNNMFSFTIQIYLDTWRAARDVIASYMCGCLVSRCIMSTRVWLWGSLEFDRVQLFLKSGFYVPFAILSALSVAPRCWYSYVVVCCCCSKLCVVVAPSCMLLVLVVVCYCCYLKIRELCVYMCVYVCVSTIMHFYSQHWVATMLPSVVS